MCLPVQEIQDTGVRSLGWEVLWRRKRQPTSVFFPGKFHRERSLAGYSPGGHKELDTTEATELQHHWFSDIWFVNIFSRFVACSFILLIVSFAMQNPLDQCSSTCLFSFLFPAFGYCNYQVIMKTKVSEYFPGFLLWFQVLHLSP